MAESGGMKTRRRVAAAICALLGIAVLLGLGTWQILRLEQKEAQIAARQTRLAQEPLEALPEAVTAKLADRLDFRPARLFGQFLPEIEFQLGSQTYGRKVGRHIIVPFRLADGRVLLVNRGWVPEDLQDPGTRPESRPKASAAVTGLLRAAPLRKPSGFTPENDVAGNFWHWLDTQAMLREAGVQAGIAAVYLQATAAAGEDAETALPRPLPPDVSLRNSHLEYALTWYALALVLAIIALVFLRQNRRKDP